MVTITSIFGNFIEEKLGAKPTAKSRVTRFGLNSAGLGGGYLGVKRHQSRKEIDSLMEGKIPNSQTDFEINPSLEFAILRTALMLKKHRKYADTDFEFTNYLNEKYPHDMLILGSSHIGNREIVDLTMKIIKDPKPFIYNWMEKEAVFHISQKTDKFAAIESMMYLWLGMGTVIPYKAVNRDTTIDLEPINLGSNGQELQNIEFDWGIFDIHPNGMTTDKILITINAKSNEIYERVRQKLVV